MVAFLLTLQQDWGEKDASDSYRVVRELLPKTRFGPEELLLWRMASNNATKGPDVRMKNAALPSTVRPTSITAL